MDDQGHKSRRRLQWIVAVLGLIVIIITATVLFTNKPESGGQKPRPQPSATEIANQFIEAVVASDGPASFDLMTKRLQKQLGNPVWWDRFLLANFREDDEGLTLLESDDIQASENPKPLRVVYEIDFDGTDVRRVELVIRYSENSWKVDEFKASGGAP